MLGYGRLFSLGPRALASATDLPRFPPFFGSKSSFARASIARLMQIQADSVYPHPQPSSPLVPSLRPLHSLCAPPRFFPSDPANPMARHRQLHPRKSARQFVTRNSSV